MLAQRCGVATARAQQQVAQLARGAVAASRLRDVVGDRLDLGVRIRRRTREAGPGEQRQVGPVVADHRDGGPIEIERGADLRALHVADVMHPQPRLVNADALAVDAADVMEQHRITSVLVVDAGGVLVGALNSNDLMRAKVI